MVLSGSPLQSPQAPPMPRHEPALPQTSPEPTPFLKKIWNALVSKATQLAGTSEPEPSTRIAVLSDACDWRPTDTLPRWSLFKNQNDCSTVTTGPVTEPFWTSGSTAGPWALKPRAPRVPWSIVSESESIASRCST